MKIFIILITATLFSCVDDYTKRYVTVCNCEQREKMADYIIKATKAGNNMSDEEMEDVIRVITNEADKLFCDKRFVWYKGEGYTPAEKLYKLDSCEVIYSYF